MYQNIVEVLFSSLSKINGDAAQVRYNLVKNRDATQVKQVFNYLDMGGIPPLLHTFQCGMGLFLTLRR